MAPFSPVLPIRNFFSGLFFYECVVTHRAIPHNNTHRQIMGESFSAGPMRLLGRQFVEPPRGKPQPGLVFLTDQTVTINGRTISGSGNTVRGSNNSVLGNNNRVVGNNNLVYGRGCISEGKGNMILSVPSQGEQVRRPRSTRKRRRVILGAPRKRRRKTDPFRAIAKAKGTPVQDDEDGCAICFENRRDILIRPCKHIRCCPPCVRQLTKCPECDQKIEDTELVYP